MKSWGELRAEDVMSSPVVTVNVDTSLNEAAEILSEHQISGVLVTDGRGAPVGVVSLFDIASHVSGMERPAGEPGGFYRYSYPRFAEGGEGWEAGWDEEESSSLKETPTGEIMTSEIITVPTVMPLAEVARTMWKRKIHRVFVAGESGPVGVISSMDILGAVSGARRAKAQA